MGIETALLVAAVASAGSQIVGGIQANNEAGHQSRIATSEAQARADEATRQSERQATLEQRNIDDTEQRQKLAYLASGVTLEGSPLLMLEQTRKRGAENIDEIRKSGSASSNAALAEGRATADAAKRAGRQALIGGITGAVSTAGSAYKLKTKAV